jgi:hypothetical protein
MASAILQRLKDLSGQNKDLLVVVLSGLAGGLLATAVQALLRSDGNLVTFVLPALSPGKYAFFGL